MDDKPAHVVIWQRIVSPHMAHLASAVSAGAASVTYVADELISASRRAQGWSAPDLDSRVNLLVGADARDPKLVEHFPKNAIHIVGGIRRNGYIARVTSDLSRLRLRWGAMVETVDDRGWKGVIKRLDYRTALPRLRPDFILAIGHRTAAWMISRGMSSSGVFPYAYFIPRSERTTLPVAGPFRFGFVGQLVELKRVDLLLRALGRLTAHDFTLSVIGDGPSRPFLSALSSSVFGNQRVTWHGRQPMEITRSLISNLDCLVLPSEHDGWGVVVSEALLAGVPAICSDACGAATAVDASGAGGVFPSGSLHALAAKLRVALESGQPDVRSRHQLSEWAECLAPNAGAQYLLAIMRHLYQGGTRPRPPWQTLGPP